jgi:hypothetical protein
MSNSLAVATVTAALAAQITQSIQQVVSGAQVVIGRPQTTPPQEATHWVQLFLYQVVPNAALRNADLVTRNSAGKLVQRPQVALDLHYLLAFYGEEKDFEPQRMLGAVTRDLHANPVLLPAILENAINSWPSLQGSNLHQQLERVKVTPLPLSLEELSKLWSVFFQTPYALSLAYNASLVLIETDDLVEPALPVLQRGENDQGVDTLLGAIPQLEKIHIGFVEDADLPPLPSLPNAWLGLRLGIQGQHLAGDSLSLRFSHSRSEDLGLVDLELAIDASNRSATSINFTLPNDAQAQSDWAAGSYSVVAVITQGTRVRASNPLILNLGARITKIIPANPVAIAGDGSASLGLTVSPQILPDQEVTLLLGGRELIAEPLPSAGSQVDVVIADADPLALQPVYLRVDGVDSLPIARAINPPLFVFDPLQQVEIQ